MAGVLPPSPVVVYDEDQYYMGGVLAELLAAKGLSVAIVTPGNEVSSFCRLTDEQTRVHRRLAELGVEIVLSRRLVKVESGALRLACTYTGREEERAWRGLVLVTARNPDDALYRALTDDGEALAAAGIRSVTRIGDCLVPGAVVHAVYGGHKYAREFGESIDPDRPYRREMPALG
jgi:dimethylamine/trimethylamine dehydrogenase